MNLEIDTFKVLSTTVHTLKYNYFEISEALPFLNETEKIKIESFKNLKRKQEYAATRILKHQLFGFETIEYNHIGAPIINGQGFISISHARNIVGIAVNKLFPIGFDMEPIRDKVLKLHSKFLSNADKANENLDERAKYTAIWSGKECLYKLAGRKEIIFKEQLILEHIDQDDYKGTIINPEKTICGKLKIINKENTLFSINISKFE